jgi:hypothetical protein
MGLPSHTFAGIGVGDGQKQSDNSGREQNRIEHELSPTKRPAQIGAAVL